MKITFSPNKVVLFFVVLPGHPAELSDYIKLLLIDVKCYVFEIVPV